MFRVFQATMIVIAVSQANANAALVAYEGFDYAASTSLNGANGGTGDWDSVWRTGASPNVPSNVATTGLSYPGLVVSGPAADTTNAATSIDFRNVGPFTSGDVWISFLAKPEAQNAITGGSNFFGLSVYDSSDAGSGSVMSISKSAASSKWGLLAFPTNANGSGPHGTTGTNFPFTNAALPDIVVNETYFLVAQFHFATGVGADTADTVSLYVNPVPGAVAPGTASVVYTDTIAPLTGGLSFDRIRLGTQNGRDWLVDEIRIGDAFADVAPVLVPEPTSAGLLLLCASGLLIGRTSARTRREIHGNFTTNY